MTYTQIKEQVATYFEKTTSEITNVGGIDAFNLAINFARLQAEQIHDFSWERKLCSIVVSPSAGGSLESAVLYGTSTVVKIKRVIEVGHVVNNHLWPITWTTSERRLHNLRIKAQLIAPEADLTSLDTSNENAQLLFTGNSCRIFPTQTANVTLGIEAFVHASDWPANQVAEDSWLFYGGEYLLWATIVHLNHRFKHFVNRQEGNLPPPSSMSDAALLALRATDAYRMDAALINE